MPEDSLNPYATSPIWDWQSDSSSLYDSLLDELEVEMGERPVITVDLVGAILQLEEFGFDLSDPDIRKRAIRAAHFRATRTESKWQAAVRLNNAMQPIQNRPGSVVYFIRHLDMVKIGTTVQGAQRRLSNMQLPPGAAVVAVIEGANRADESALHVMFAASRVQGEWFKITPELQALINTHHV